MEHKYNRKTIDIGNKELYSFYEKNTKEPLIYKDWAKVLKLYNNKVIAFVLKGNTYSFGEGLSAIRIIEGKRRNRLDKNGNPILPVSWSQTNKLNEFDSNGNKILVYITDQPYYYMVKWYHNLKNGLEFYKFKPCRNFTRKLSIHLSENPFAANKFKKLI